MQNDDVIWSVLQSSHCSYLIKTKTQNFCRNEYNVSGLCGRKTCPLSNSQYATVREEQGECFLYVKTIERAAFPAKLWEKIKLSRQYPMALQQIDKHLMYWPKHQIHKCKQRLTKIVQYLIRIKQLQLQSTKKLITMPSKIERRDRRREMKALIAAKLETSIERQLLQRLKTGTYGDIYNFHQKAFEQILKDQQVEDSEKVEKEMELELLSDDEEKIEYVADFDESSEDEDEDEDVDVNVNVNVDVDDIEDLQIQKPSSSKIKKKKPHIEIEYEYNDNNGNGKIKN